MATKRDKLFLKPKFSVTDQLRTDRSCEFWNLNLNQKCSDNDQVFSKSNNVTKSGITVTDNFEIKEKRWNKSTKDLCLKSSKNPSFIDGAEVESRKSRIINDKNFSNKNRSTLSLHIAAYENSFEVDDLPATFKSSKFSELKSQTYQDFFEFPRQMDGMDGGAPDVMQFKSGQKLLDPKQDASSDPFADNQYEIPAFGNKDLPPPPTADPKSGGSDSLASHKGRLSNKSFQTKGGSAVKGKNKKNKKLDPGAVKNYKKNKTKGSIQQDELKSGNEQATGDDPFDENNAAKKGKKTKSDEKKSGGSKSGGASVKVMPSGEIGSFMAATGPGASENEKPKRKKTAQEIIAERQRYRGSVKKDVVISAIILTIALVVIIGTIIGIGAASNFEFKEI